MLGEPLEILSKSVQNIPSNMSLHGVLVDSRPSFEHHWSSRFPYETPLNGLGGWNFVSISGPEVEWRSMAGILGIFSGIIGRGWSDSSFFFFFFFVVVVLERNDHFILLYENTPARLETLVGFCGFWRFSGGARQVFSGPFRAATCPTRLGPVAPPPPLNAHPPTTRPIRAFRLPDSGHGLIDLITRNGSRRRFDISRRRLFFISQQPSPPAERCRASRWFFVLFFCYEVPRKRKRILLNAGCSCSRRGSDAAVTSLWFLASALGEGLKGARV